MTRRPYPKGNANALIMCANKACDNIAGDQITMTDKTIAILRQYLESMTSEYMTGPSCQPAQKKVLEQSRTKLLSELKETHGKLNRAYDFVEQGVYSPEEFITRSALLKAEIADLEDQLQKVEANLEHEQRILDKKESYIPRLRNALDIFYSVSPAEQNALLMELIERIDYIKESRSGKYGPKDNFELYIQLKLPIDDIYT